MKRFLQFAVSLTFGGFILYLVLRHFEISQTLTAIRSARLDLLSFGICLMVIGYLLRGMRWRIWERSLSYWDSLRLVLIGFMGNNLLPGRLGELLRAHCAAAKLDRERGRTAALASIAAERVIDGLVLAAIGLAAMTLSPVEKRLRGVLLIASWAFTVLAISLIVVMIFHERIRSAIAGLSRKFPGHVTKFVNIKAGHFLDGLLPLGTFSRMASALTVTTLIWGLEIGFYYFVGRSVWPGMDLRIAVPFMVVVNFASLIPLTIGGIGTIEAAALAFLTSVSIPAYPALAMILIQHGAQYVFTTLTGGLVYFAGGFYRISLTSPKGKVTNPKVIPDAIAVIEGARSSLSELGRMVDLIPAQRADADLSIVIPAYNEQSRLPRTVLEALHFCTTQKLDFELIIADDGSRDETLTLARLFEESDRRVRAIACPHMGKGATVRMGVLNAKGRLVLFMDADGATPMSEIPKLISAIEAGHDVAIGSRVLQSPGQVEVKTALHRKIIGRIFAFFVNLFAVDGIADSQCGFKMFRGDAARAIFSRQKSTGFAFDVEVLFLARRLSATIIEIPVNWTAQAGSKVNLVTDSIKMLWDICLIRWMHRNSDYRDVRGTRLGGAPVGALEVVKD